MRYLASIALLLLCACTTMHERTVGPVRIRADSPTLADNCAAAVASTLPAFTVPHTRAVTLIVRNGPPHELSGVAHDDKAIVAVDSRCSLPDSPLATELAAVLTHELQHLYIPQLQREHLPALLEEGLVDHRMLALLPGIRAQRRAEHALRLLSSFGIRWSVCTAPGDSRLLMPIEMLGVPRFPPLDEAFAINQHDLGDLADADSQLLTSIGWFLVERAGESAVVSLVERAAREGVAKVPAAWMIEAAGLADREPSSWPPLIALLIGDPEELVIAGWQTSVRTNFAHQ